MAQNANSEVPIGGEPGLGVYGRRAHAGWMICTSNLTGPCTGLQPMVHKTDRYWLRRINFDPVNLDNNPNHGKFEDEVLPLAPAKDPPPLPGGEIHGLDTPERIRFAEPDFFALSSYAPYALIWDGRRFDTEITAYYYEMYRGSAPDIADRIHRAMSAVEARQIAKDCYRQRRREWDTINVDVAREIKREKLRQHPAIQELLLSTGWRELVDDSRKDNFWGWGPKRAGRNMSGQLWMELRRQLREMALPDPAP